MFVCVHELVHICVYVHAYGGLCVCLYMGCCTYVCMHVHRRQVSEYVCVCMVWNIYVCMWRSVVNLTCYATGSTHRHFHHLHRYDSRFCMNTNCFSCLPCTYTSYCFFLSRSLLLSCGKTNLTLWVRQLT